MAQDWEIKPRSDACDKCTVPFGDGQPCFSALFFGEEGYTRADFCEKCWQEKGEDNTPYSAWQGVYTAPPAEPEEALEKETAESLLRKLIEEKDDSRRNVVYILAVMLERKRLLVEREVKADDSGSKTLVYEHRKTGETFLVSDPGLRLDQLEPVQQEVVAMLGGGEQEAGDRVQGSGFGVPASAEATAGKRESVDSGQESGDEIREPAPDQ